MIFHVDQLRYVVVELKVGEFDSGHVGQLGTYVALVDDRLRKPDRHAHTVGILLVAGAALPRADELAAILEHDPGDEPAHQTSRRFSVSPR